MSLLYPCLCGLHLYVLVLTVHPSLENLPLPEPPSEPANYNSRINRRQSRVPSPDAVELSIDSDRQ